MWAIITTPPPLSNNYAQDATSNVLSAMYQCPGLKGKSE